MDASAAPPDSAGVKVMPPTVFYICLLGGIAAEISLGTSVPLVPWPARLAAGSLVAVVGFVFSLWGHGRFKALGINLRPDRPASQLVTTGAHGFSRNPMYCGFIAMLFGIGMAAGSLAMMASAVPMFVFLNWYVIPREERYLTRTFGESYNAYCKKVRRWL